MSDLAQGAVYTAIAKRGKLSAGVGRTERGPPLEFSEFVQLMSKSQSYNLYLGKVPNPGDNREQELEELYRLAQERAPLITQTVDIARHRVNKLQKMHNKKSRDSDLQGEISFVRGET